MLSCSRLSSSVTFRISAASLTEFGVSSVSAGLPLLLRRVESTVGLSLLEDDFPFGNAGVFTLAPTTAEFFTFFVVLSGFFVVFAAAPFGTAGVDCPPLRVLLAGPEKLKSPKGTIDLRVCFSCDCVLVWFGYLPGFFLGITVSSSSSSSTPFCESAEPNTRAHSTCLQYR